MNYRKITGIILFTLGLALLTGLGFWQVYRAQWKEAIIAQINYEYRKDPRQYDLQPADLVPPRDGEFYVQRGTVRGRFLDNRTTYWPRVRESYYGFYVMDPLLLRSGEIILVNRGWIREDLHTHQPSYRLPLPPSGMEVSLTGAAKTMESGFMALENDPVNNRWHRFKVKELAQYLDLDNLAPTVFTAETVNGRSDYWLGKQFLNIDYPRNRHRQYALFWFVMAGLWVVIFGTRVFKRDYT